MKRPLLLLIVFSLCLAVLGCGKEVRQNTLFIDVLSIGKADCTIIRQGDCTVVIDCGEEENFPVVSSFLKQNGITDIDVLILSHFDKDHIGGAELLIRSYDVKRVLESSFSSDRPEFEAYHLALEEQNKEAEKLTEDTRLLVGDCSFLIDVPKKEHYEKKEDNNASLIVTLSFSGKNFGFFGDALEERLGEFLLSSTEKYDFAKLPHHGSYHDSYESFLDKIQCSDAVITSSFKNPPNEKTMELLENKNVKTYLTQNGSVHVRCEEEIISILQK